MTLCLPPGVLLVAMAILAFLAFKHRHDRRFAHGAGGQVFAAWLAGLVLAGWLMATPAFGGWLSGILVDNIKGKELADPRQAQVIVVLTGGMIDAGPVGWMPKPDGINRLAVAYELQRLINLRLPVILSGGHTAGVQNPSEAAVTATFFARQRTELTPTELEEASTDTYESAMQLAPILAKRGVQNVLLVTSDVHMLRAAATFRARGVDVVPAPALTLPTNMGVKAYLPSAVGMMRTADALYEMLGTAVYWLSGRISWADIAYNAGAARVDVPAEAALLEAKGAPDAPAPVTIEEPETGMQIAEPVGTEIGAPAAPGLLPEPRLPDSGAGGLDAPDGVDIR